jgi:hypothetical protein
MKSRRKVSSSGVKKANTDISKESSPKNKKPLKIAGHIYPLRYFHKAGKVCMEP